MEDCQSQGNAQTFKKLAMVQAAILLWCYFYKIPCTLLAPSHWRSIIKDNYGVKFGTKRVDQKLSAQNFIQEKYEKKLSQDEADAICINIAGQIEKKNNTSAW